MSENFDNLSDSVRWGSRLAVVGIMIAVLSLVVSIIGIGSANPLYWAGIVLSIIAVTGAAIRGARTTDTDGDSTPDYNDTNSDGDSVPDSEEGTTDTDGDGISDYKHTDTDGDSIPELEEEYSRIRHPMGVFSAMIGVFIIGYGSENGILLIMLIGVVLLVVGAIGVITDTQRTE